MEIIDMKNLIIITISIVVAVYDIFKLYIDENK